MHVLECLCFTVDIFAFCNKVTLTSAEWAAGCSVLKACTPLYPTFKTVAVDSKLFRYLFGVHLWWKEVVNFLKTVLDQGDHVWWTRGMPSRLWRKLQLSPKVSLVRGYASDSRSRGFRVEHHHGGSWWPDSPSCTRNQSDYCPIGIVFYWNILQMETLLLNFCFVFCLLFFTFSYKFDN